MNNYYVYILANNSKTLYIGITNNLLRRIYEHKHKLIEGFTKKYNLTKLVYYETTNSINDAIKREKQLKNWHRQWKINLIESINKEWKDLSSEWLNSGDAETSSA
jgi:putative endonuclease